MNRLALTALFGSLVASGVASPAEFVIKNGNKPGRGFNEKTAVEPAGLNFATTRGGQAQLVFRAGAALWGAVLKSNVPIVVDAAFATAQEDDSFSCANPDRVVLGFANKGGVFKDANFPKPDIAYPYALAESLAGRNLSGATADIRTRFNADLGRPACPGFAPWNMSLAEDGTTLLATLAHELGHGLGFLSNVNITTGGFVEGGALPYDSILLDLGATTPQSWVSSGPTARLALVTKPQGSVLGGPNLQREIPRFLGFAPTLEVRLGAGAAESITYVPGSFSNDLVGGGEIVLASPADACAALPAGSLTGKYALIRRGTCTFIDKAQRAVMAGAIGVLISNNVEGLLQMSPSMPKLSVPAMMITQADGARIEQQLATGTARVDFGTGGVRSNANNFGVYLYTPPAVEGGSSVSHFNTNSAPNALMMEPSADPSARLNLDLTPAAMADMGWPVWNGLTLSLVKALEEAIKPGGEVKYLMAIINRRPTDIASVTLELTGAGIDSVKDFAGGCTAVPCSLGMLRSGDTRFVIATVKAKGSVADDFAVTATLTPSTAGAEDNLAVTATNAVSAGGDVSVTITEAPALERETVANFTTTVKNNGPSGAADVAATVKLTADDGTALKIIGECAGADPCTKSELLAGEEWKFVTTFAVPSDFRGGATFTASVTTSSPDSNASNNTASSKATGGGCSAIGSNELAIWSAGLALLALLKRRLAPR